MKIVGYIILGLACVAGLAFFFAGLGTSVRAVFEPKNVAIDNQVFRQSQQFNDGMARDLDNMRMQWADPATTQAQKDIIRDTIIHRYAGYDAVNLPADLQVFLNQVKGS